jgi:sulfur carrier protein ThiS
VCSSDLRKNWSAAAGISGFLQDCSINNNEVAVAVSGNTASFSTNGGQNWTQPTSVPGFIQGCSINDSGVVVAVNNNGAAFFVSEPAVGITGFDPSFYMRIL